MPITIRPLPIPSFKIDQTTSSIPVPYLVMGSQDELDVKEMVRSNSPVWYRGLVRSDCDAEHQGGGVWIATITYKNIPRQQAILGSSGSSGGGQGENPENPTAPGSNEPLTALNGGSALSFDTTGQTIHITQSRRTRYRRSAADGAQSGTNLTVDASSPDFVTPDGYAPAGGDVGKTVVVTGGDGWITGSYVILAQAGGQWQLDGAPAVQGTAGGEWVMLSDTDLNSIGSAPDLKHAIGVSRDSVAGCDIFAPKLEFQLDVKRGNVTLDYLLTLFSMTGKVNYDAAWWNFPAGTILYMGANGRFAEEDRWNLTHKFAYSPNEKGLLIGDIVIPEKKGWDYLWCRYAESDIADGTVPLPLGAYVEIVYPTGSFSSLEIG